MMQQVKVGQVAELDGGLDVPRDEQGREIISVRGLLEWAFATECAQLDFDELEAVANNGWSHISSTYMIGEMGALGKEPGECVRVDTSFGRSLPHDDAEIVATVLRHAVPFHLAVRVAELARTCRTPDWNLGPQRMQPAAWGKKTGAGQHGKTEVCDVVQYLSNGRLRRREERWVPVVVTPTTAQIAAARRDYLAWWGALLSVLGDLRHVELTRFALSDRLPPMSPWAKAA